MTEKEYRLHPAISRSELFRISESPEKFKYYKDNPPSPTPALIFGQAFHKAVLEPRSFNKEFAVMPNVDRRTKEGKALHESFLQESREKTIICAEDFLLIKEMAKALKKNEYVKKLLSGKKEKAYFWTDELSGEECKCRVDCLNTKFSTPIIIDLKTTLDASTEGFTKAAIKHGYDFQAAMYSEGVKKNIKKDVLFVFIAIEKTPPYAINIFQADELFIKRGYDLFREYIGIYSECKQKGEFWGYLGHYNQINNLSLPSYLAKEIE